MKRAKWFGLACVLAFSQMLVGCGGGGGSAPGTGANNTPGTAPGTGANNTPGTAAASGVTTANVIVTTVISTQQ